MIGGLLLVGYFYSELPATSALLLASTPLAVIAVPAAVTRGRPAWHSLLLHGGAALAVVLAALVIAYRSTPPFEPYY